MDLQEKIHGLPLWVGESRAAELLCVHVQTLRKMRDHDKQLSRRLPGMVRRKYSTVRIQQILSEAVQQEEI